MTEICPICKGKGKIPYEREIHPDVVIPSTTNMEVRMAQCHGCNGKGWISPNNEHWYPPDYPIYPSYPVYPTYPTCPTYPHPTWYNATMQYDKSRIFK
jgi:hypothetical protein